MSHPVESRETSFLQVYSQLPPCTLTQPRTSCPVKGVTHSGLGQLTIMTTPLQACPELTLIQASQVIQGCVKGAAKSNRHQDIR